MNRKLLIWSHTPIYTFSYYLESSIFFCIGSRMFTPLHNYLNYSNIHGLKTMSRPRVIYRHRRQDRRLDVLFIYTLAPQTDWCNYSSTILNIPDITRGSTHIGQYDYNNLSRILIHYKLFTWANTNISQQEQYIITHTGVPIPSILIRIRIAIVEVRQSFDRLYSTMEYIIHMG